MRAQVADREPCTELSLPQSPLVALLLRAKIQDLRAEIEDLRSELDEDQDQDTMEDIQELIGVRLCPGSSCRARAAQERLAADPSLPGLCRSYFRR